MSEVRLSRNHAVENGSARVSRAVRAVSAGISTIDFNTRKGEDKVSATMCLARRQTPRAGDVCSPSNCIVPAKKKVGCGTRTWN
jgi:hypothetical protein